MLHKKNNDCHASLPLRVHGMWQHKSCKTNHRDPVIIQHLLSVIPDEKTGVFHGGGQNDETTVFGHLAVYNSINNGQVTRVTFSYILFVDVEKSMRKSKQE